MPDTDQDQNQGEPYQLTGDDLSELYGLAQQLQSTNDPRAGKLWDFIAGQSGGGDGSEAPTFSMSRSPLTATSWLDDLENDLWGETAGGDGPHATGSSVGGNDSGSGGDNSVSATTPESGTQNAISRALEKQVQHR